MLTEPKIVIIGAGAAGISAASRLLQEGLGNITILEAKDRIGGRICTKEFGDNVVELGAQWVHGERGNVVFDLAFPHKLLDSSQNFHDFNKYVFATHKGLIIPRAESTEAIRIYHEIDEHSDDEMESTETSYGKYFVKEFKRIFEENPFTTQDRAKQFLDWMEKYDNSIQCSDTWYEVSAKRLLNYWKCEGDPVLNWKYYGYKTVFDLLMQKIPEPKNTLPVLEKVEFNKDVATIDYTSNNNVVVKTKDGSYYSAAHVIVTTSLGVLKERHTTMFQPPLPEMKLQAIKGLNIGAANKIFLEFPHRWWEENCACLNLIWSEEDKAEFLESHGKQSSWLFDVFSFFAVDYQPRLLCAWIVGEKSRYMETLPEAEVLEGLYLLLDSFFGKAYNVTKPDRMLRSNWYTDEHFRGSYSFQSMMSEQLNVFPQHLAAPIITDNGKPTVMFAGEATHDHYYSTVHGAVETGIREANRILGYQRRLNSHL